MHANSRTVSSPQLQVHQNLKKVVQKHLKFEHRAKLRPHNIEAYKALCHVMENNPLPLILDSFCGTGHSTALLAEQNPEHFVLGIDQSAQRLSRHAGSPANNYHLLHANCEDIWQQMVADGLRVAAHYILYPNPWPKPGQLQRRVHGHASFGLLLALGGELELRSNWDIYVEEFCIAMQIAGVEGVVQEVPSESVSLSLFEEKYRNSGQRLWSYRSHRDEKEQIG